MPPSNRLIRDRKLQAIGHTEGRTQRYEEVPQKLTQAVQIWHRDDPKLEFVLSLGDIIDGRPTQVSCLSCVLTLGGQTCL